MSMQPASNDKLHKNADETDYIEGKGTPAVARRPTQNRGLDLGQQIRDSMFFISGQDSLFQAFTLFYRPGIQVVLWRRRIKRPQKIYFEIYKPHIEFEFHLKGKARYSLLSRYEPASANTLPGHWALNQFKECEGEIDCLPSESGLNLSIILKPQALVQNSWHLASLLLPFLENNRNYARLNPTLRRGMMTPAMLAAASQLVDCPYTGPIRDVFLESKAMELIALQMAIIAHEEEPQKSQRLGEDELMAVRMAKEILLTDLNTPPKLENLAREVGLNRNKLNRGFRELYGATAFEMLRAERLARAKVFLQNTRMPLAEIAQAAGYCAQSHFTSAFAAQFGVTPGQFRKRAHHLDTAKISF